MRLLQLTAAFSVLVLSATAQPTWSREAAMPNFAVGAQFDTTHVYVAPDEVEKFVESFLATFGGKSTKQVVVTVTPTPSSNSSQLLLTPAGSVSVFGFRTPIPYPFGHERTGYLVTDLDAAVRSAQSAGAAVLVKTFPDPIGRDAVVQWPGGINMQLYWHTTAPAYDALQTIPENRVYVPASKAEDFVKSFVRFSKGSVISDNGRAPGTEIGRPSDFYRRVRITSKFGLMTVLVTDGILPYPYGHEMTGYEVPALDDTLAKAKAAGATVLVEPYVTDQRRATFVKFPGGYVAEIHSRTGK
jgi:predicted enzyme related to lactoylglutathione lyase